MISMTAAVAVRTVPSEAELLRALHEALEAGGGARACSSMLESAPVGRVGAVEVCVNVTRLGEHEYDYHVEWDYGPVNGAVSSGSLRTAAARLHRALTRAETGMVNHG
jgi:hypothetical protein